MRSLSGYAVTVQSFVLSDEHSRQVSRLSLVSPPARDVRSQVMEGSAMGDITAPVVAVGNALDTDIPDVGLSGNIALIERGSISFAEQANRVAEAGAVGAIIYNSEERTFRNGQPFSGTLIEGDYNGSSIPVTGIWREEGTNILNALNEGTEVRARLKTASEKWASQNIIAENAGTDSGADVVVVGAHYDTHRNSQGASDNGTGVASLMVMADEISGLQLAHTVRFIFFGAEEPGLHGSRHYVESLSRSERSEIIAMLNLTSLGSGRPAVKTGGSTVLTDWVIDTYAPQQSLDVRYWGPPHGFSDHYWFYKSLGVPVISFHGDDLSVSNSPDDVIGLVGSSVMGTQMAIALEMIKQAPNIVPQPQPAAPPPFTAYAQDLPERHDGERAFRFYLIFNLHPDELSHRTVRDGLLHIGGADITDVSRALGFGNFAWWVTVEPTQRGDITIRLPVRDCTDTASVCADGRPLSEGLSRTVLGPDSSVTSMPNTPAAGGPVIEGSPVVGETLAAATTGIIDADGMTGAVFAFKWLADDAEMANATSSSYTLTDSEQGKAIKVRVTFTDDAGNDETLTSDATEAVKAANSPATGAPTTSGTAQVGETLTATTTGIIDADGMTGAVFAFKWLADDAEMANATSSSYTLTDSEQGKAIKVRVTFTDDAGNDEALTSDATEAVKQPLTASIENAPDSHDGQSVFTFELRFSEEFGLSYKILRDHAFTVTGGAAIKARRLNPPGNVRWEISVRPSGDGALTIVLPATTDCASNGAVCTEDGRKLSSALEITVPGREEQQESNSPATGAPTISGRAQVGETLTATTSGIVDADGIANAVFAYQWLADNAAIGGATASTYTVLSGDVGKVIKVRVTFTDDAGNDETVTSSATGAVAAANSTATGAPTISGTAQAGETLTADTSGISDTDGLTGAAFAYQWLADDATIGGATASTYTVLSGDVGKAIKVRVTFTDDMGNEKSLTSAATVAVTQPLTATIHDAPDSHDGQSKFTFELRFSEQFGLSYKTLRDHAFTVAGGEVVKARRLEKGKNVRWEIHVRPDSANDVTIVLPATTDCVAQGAVCTEDGRMLSSRLELTVAGP